MRHRASTIKRKIIESEKSHKLSLMNSTYLETGEVGDVVERHLLDVELEAALVGDLTEGAIGVALCVSDLELTAVPLCLVLLSLIEGHGMRVLVFVVLCQLEGIEAEAFAELRKVHCLELSQSGRPLEE